MKEDIQTVKPNDFVLYKRWVNKHRYNCNEREKFNWPHLETLTGRVKDVIDYQCNGKPDGTAIEFENGDLRPIEFCQIIFRGTKKDKTKEKDLPEKKLNYPRYANVPFSY